MQLSLDEQDEQGPYFDKADQEALQSALIRSVYDKGGREVPAAINVLTSDDQDEEVSIFWIPFPTVIVTKILSCKES